MKPNIDLQIAVNADALIPKITDFELWAKTCLEICKEFMSVNLDAEITVRIVEPQESQQLNFEYRGKDYATNVLSFPFENEFIELNLLGDLVICHQVVENEANQANKNIIAHYAHLTIHGILHLLGFDHQNENEANEMEGLEVQILHKLGFSDPYQI